jgi:hypothetical protein
MGERNQYCAFPKVFFYDYVLQSQIQRFLKALQEVFCFCNCFHIVAQYFLHCVAKTKVISCEIHQSHFEYAYHRLGIRMGERNQYCAFPKVFFYDYVLNILINKTSSKVHA